MTSTCIDERVDVQSVLTDAPLDRVIKAWLYLVVMQCSSRRQLKKNKHHATYAAGLKANEGVCLRDDTKICPANECELFCMTSAAVNVPLSVTSAGVDKDLNCSIRAEESTLRAILFSFDLAAVTGEYKEPSTSPRALEGSMCLTCVHNLD